MAVLGGVQCLMSEVPLQPSERDQIVSFELPDLYHRSPDSGELKYISRELTKAI